jgi:hypothetical protein
MDRVELEDLGAPAPEVEPEPLPLEEPTSPAPEDEETWGLAVGTLFEAVFNAVARRRGWDPLSDHEVLAVATPAGRILARHLPGWASSSPDVADGIQLAAGIAAVFAARAGQGRGKTEETTPQEEGTNHGGDIDGFARPTL